jgi:hypothetical protein
MWLQTSAGTHVQVTAIKKWTATQRVHNLTVDDIHTYYVLAGDQAILVHNDGIFDAFKKKQSPSPESPAANTTVRRLLDVELGDVDGSEMSNRKAGMLSGLSDEDLLDSVFNPHGGPGNNMALYSDGKSMTQGNHRARELLERAGDLDSAISLDTPIHVKGC